MIGLIFASFVKGIMIIVALFVAGIYAMCKAICYFQRGDY